ncbi:MAG: L,D-transpeptidase, partial [Candidatus Aquicultor sp.]
IVTRAEASALIWNILYKEPQEGGSYPAYIAPYLPKPTITFPRRKQVVFTKDYSVTAQIDPESSAQELWVDGKLAQTKHAGGSNTVTFTGLKAINRTYSISVRTKNGSAFTSTGVVSYYCLQAPSGYNHLIVIDKSEFSLYWIIDGFMKKIYQVAIGRDGMATPNAEWIVGQKYKTDPKGVYGPRKMRLYRLMHGTYEYTRYGIHGTNEPWVIGTRASHGCIRMRNKEVLELWPQVDVGDHVVTQP